MQSVNYRMAGKLNIESIKPGNVYRELESVKKKLKSLTLVYDLIFFSNLFICRVIQCFIPYIVVQCGFYSGGSSCHSHYRYG